MALVSPVTCFFQTNQDGRQMSPELRMQQPVFPTKPCSHDLDLCEKPGGHIDESTLQSTCSRVIGELTVFDEFLLLQRVTMSHVLTALMQYFFSVHWPITKETL